MIRILAYLILVAIAIAASVWLADRPGSVEIQWLGYRLDTSVPVLILAAVLVGIAAWIAMKFIAAIWTMPRDLGRARTATRQRKGVEALAGGLAAIAAGDRKQAKKLARRADSFLADPAVTKLLSAQAAELGGDADAAEKHYREMLDDPRTRFVGLKGLMVQALRRDDREAALDYGMQAFAINAEAEGLARSLFPLQAAAGDWEGAQKSLSIALRRGDIPTEDAPELRAIILTERAGLALGNGDLREAARLARQAHEAEPHFVPAVLKLAQVLRNQNNAKRAAKILEESWRDAPQRDYVDAYLGLWPDEDELQQVRRVEKLIARNPDHPESHLALGEASLRAKLWGQARNRLTKAAAAIGDRRPYRLLAQLEQEEKGDAEAAQAWLAKAAEAPPGPAWACRACGEVLAEYSAVCPSCAALGEIGRNNRRLALPTPEAQTA